MIRVGCWAGAWGDTTHAAPQLLRGSDVDYLAEVTMALLARARAKDTRSGYVNGAVSVIGPLLGEICDRGIRVVTNAGALNPAGLGAALAAAAAEAGVKPSIAVVEGDDLSRRWEDVRASAVPIGAELPAAAIMTANAYLGARPIATALDAGAQIVVTGRCVDSALVLGPLMHEFGWTDRDSDQLSAGSLVGHILECGTQATGGLLTDFETVEGWENMGAPIAECHPDGSAVISKPSGTGGLVSTAGVAEQIVYEIGDPGAYALPDVVCDWRDVQLTQVGPDRVRVAGARGTTAPRDYKVTATSAAGFRLMTTVMFGGFRAGAKARGVGEAILGRADRLLGDAGMEPLQQSSVEVIGAGDTYGPSQRNDDAHEVVLKIGARDHRREALELLSREIAPAALSMAPGMTGLFAGRPRVAPAIAIASLLIDKGLVPVAVTLDGGASAPVAVAPGAASSSPASPLPHDAGGATPDGVPVPLRAIAHGRSGDKGNHANIGIIARRPELLDVIRERVTPARVEAFFAHYLDGPVRAWEMPGIAALNFLLEDVLGGSGGTTSLRYDPQGKSYASMLLELPVTLPLGLV